MLRGTVDSAPPRVADRSGGLRPRAHLGNSAHDFMPPKIIDECITCLHRMQNTIRLGSAEKRPQFHKMMAAAASVETVNGNNILLATFQRASVWKCDRNNSAIGTTTLHFQLYAQQTSPLMAGIHFFHDGFDLIR